jgi:hypothetical protein
MVQQPSKECADVVAAATAERSAPLREFSPERAAAGRDRLYYRKPRQIELFAAPTCRYYPGAPAASRLAGPGGEYIGESDLSWTRLADQ